MKRHVSHPLEGLQVITHINNRNLALKLDAQLVGATAWYYFSPAIFNDRPWFNARQRELFCLEFNAAGLDDRAVEYIFLFQFGNRSVRLDDAGGDVFDLRAAIIGDIDFAL